MTRLIVTLLVRDEVDVVAATVEHHLAEGADLVIATDNSSRDGTTQVLEAYQEAGVLELIHEPDLTYRQSEWVTRMARRAARHSADWVVHVDADEFWVAKAPGTRLREALAQVPTEYDAVRAWRSDLVGVRGGDGPWPDRLRWRDRHTVSERGTPLAPKVCHRGRDDVTVAQGNHGIIGADLRLLPSEPLAIHHVPLRSWTQFRRKIDNGGAAYAANTELPPEVGWHWRADYERLLAGELEETFRLRQPSRRQVVARVLAGRYVPDSSLRRRLRDLVPRAVRPDLLRAVLEGTGPGGR